MMTTPTIGLVGSLINDFDSVDSFSLNEIGKLSLLNRHKRAFNRSKHILIDKQQQEENHILFVTFIEQTP